MKKKFTVPAGIITALTIALSTFTALPAFAAEEDAAREEAVLREVKSRVEIPAEYSEFDSYSETYGDETAYSFSWETDDYSRRIYVTADEKGRISSYNIYGIYGADSDNGKIAQFTQSDVEAAAESDIKTMLPEVDFSKLRARNYQFDSVADSEYTIIYQRYENDTPVDNNYIYLSYIDVSGELTLKYLTSTYDCDAEFEAAGEEIADTAAAYKAKNPAELKYRYISDYARIDTESADYESGAIYPVYYLGKNYVSVYTGENVEKYSEYAKLYGMEETAAVSADSADYGGGNELTEEEIKELESISGLKSTEELLTAAKAIPNLNIPADAEIKWESTEKDKYGDYFCDIGLTGDMSVTFNAETGTLMGYNRYGEYDGEAVDEAAANAAADEFLAAYAPNFSEYKLESSVCQNDYLTRRYTRYVNGIPYVNDGILLSFSLDGGCLTYYSESYSNAEFPSIDGVISADKAFEILIGDGLEKLYVKASDGVYRLCVTPERAMEIDAFTGEPSSWQYVYEETTDEHTGYTDIDGHWCEDAVKALENSGICFSRNELNPDAPVTRDDLIRLLAAVRGVDIMQKAELSDSDVSFIDPYFEDSGDAYVTRENACVYFARALRIAYYTSLNDIYKTGFTDEGSISAGRLGSVAMMHGMGVVTGDNFRPQDYLTNAEACTMLYRVLNNGDVEMF